MSNYIDDTRIWKRLIRAVIDRALRDCVGDYASNQVSTEQAKYAVEESAESFVFSYMCAFMCEEVGIDIYTMRREIKKLMILREENGGKLSIKSIREMGKNKSNRYSNRGAKRAYTRTKQIQKA